LGEESSDAIGGTFDLDIALTRQANFQEAAQARRWSAAHLSDAFSPLTMP